MDTFAYTRWCWAILLVFTSQLVAGADQCHCSSQGECVKYPDGTCTACQEFWSGPNCQIFNAAEGALLSTQRQPRGSDSGIPVSGSDSSSKCTDISDSSGTSAVWTLILNRTFTISKLTITHNTDHASSLRNFDVSVNGRQCKNVSSVTAPKSPLTIHCDQPVQGQTVSVILPLSQTEVNTLALCRVVIDVCGDHWFGDQCSSRCNCINVNEVCDKTGGRCISGTRPTTSTLKPSSDTSTRSPSTTTTTTATATTPAGAPSTAFAGTTKTMATTTVTSAGSEDGSQREPAVSLGAIAGVVCGVLLGFAILVVVIVLLVLKLCKRKRVSSPPIMKPLPSAVFPGPVVNPTSHPASFGSITNTYEGFEPKTNEHDYMGVSNPAHDTEDTTGPASNNVETVYAEIIDEDYLQPIHNPDTST
ncbi:uncharacterized protein LOC124267973 isoform X1 [Haliotis rubra]|uniref:uncharacterized protein LOC124267973 isoform X1 n=1 Tax=Haliotis rubra TaxID=36100 RepID=UPI001EE5E4DA|nr:uncharacterized protein LOC124267973 isoform X1 [Haliotis rubra]